MWGQLCAPPFFFEGTRSKGNQVKIPEPGRGFQKSWVCGNTNEPRDVGGGPGKSSLFFLTVTIKQRCRVCGVFVPSCCFCVLAGWATGLSTCESGLGEAGTLPAALTNKLTTPESGWPERGSDDRQSTSSFEVSGAPSTTLENRGETASRASARQTIFSPDRTHNRSRSPR